MEICNMTKKQLGGLFNFKSDKTQVRKFNYLLEESISFWGEH